MSIFLEESRKEVSGPGLSLLLRSLVEVEDNLFTTLCLVEREATSGGLEEDVIGGEGII